MLVPRPLREVASGHNAGGAAICQHDRRLRLMRFHASLLFLVKRIGPVRIRRAAASVVSRRDGHRANFHPLTDESRVNSLCPLLTLGFLGPGLGNRPGVDDVVQLITTNMLRKVAPRV